MTHFAIVVLFVLTSKSYIRAEEDEWIGQWVLPCSQGVTVRDRDDKVLMEWSCSAGKVTWVGNDWITIRHGQYPGPYEGYVRKSAVVKLADAPKFYTGVIERNQRDIWALNNRATAWTLTGEHKKAIEDLTVVVQIDQSASSYVVRGIAWSAKGDYAKAIKDYGEAISLEPASAYAFKTRADAWLAKQEYEKAIADYTEAIRLDPKFSDAFSNRGVAWGQKKDFDRAIKDFDVAVRLNPSDATAFNNRGYVWNVKEEYDKALKELNEAIRLDPKYAMPFANRGWSFTSKKDYDKAIKDFNEAIRLDPTSADALRGRANSWYYKLEYGKAIKDYNEAIRLDPKGTAELNAFAWLLATCMDAKYRDGKRAVELATKACELTQWKDAWMIDTLAVAYGESGDFKQAIMFEKKAIEGLTEDKQSGDECRARLRLFEQKKSYHETPKKD
jgi:tetratricopeptide (TPR) repeat protein